MFPCLDVIILLFLFFAAFFAFGQGTFKNTRTGVMSASAIAFTGAVLLLIFYTGRIHRWRRVFFATYALAFVISFVWMTMGDLGHMWLLDSEILASQAPMCHICQ